MPPEITPDTWTGETTCSKCGGPKGMDGTCTKGCDD